MSDLILHHFDGSPFSEKVRLVLGFKGLAWTSVKVPMLLPKPDVVALTGGYRRTPFLQVGADIYCDSVLMCRLIDERAPQPPLYPAAATGLQHVLSQWADTTLFWAAIPYTLQPAGAQYLFNGAPPEFAKAFSADRVAMAPHMGRATAHDARMQLVSYFGWLESQLADGRRFLFGEQPCIADFSAVHPVWFVRRVPPVADVLAPFPQLAAWYERMAAFGHGRSEKMTSAEAIALSAQTTQHAECRVDAEMGFDAGEIVTVAAADYASDKVPGTLVGLTANEIVVERSDERAGRLHVHFPRIGYELKKAKI